jgi:hypothetical protein
MCRSEGGDLFNTYIVSPLEQARDNGDANVLTQTLASTFWTSKMDIAVKRQNTAKQMRACYAWRNFEYPSQLS